MNGLPRPLPPCQRRLIFSALGQGGGQLVHESPYISAITMRGLRSE
jgi:hypothetical protein